MFNRYALKPYFIRFKDSSLRNAMLTFITFYLLNASTIYANDNYIDEESIFDEVETVVGATRLKQKITKAPVSVTIIDKEMIEASGAIEVYELLRLVPGFFSYSLSGNQYGVVSHFDLNDLPSRLEVRIDGRSIHQPIFDSVDWATIGIDVLDIDHIEVIRGTSASVYGSNAFLGAVNIVTKGSLLQKHHTSIRSTVGSIGTRNFSLNHANNLAGVEYLLSINSKRNTGFSEFTEGGDNPIDLLNDSRSSLNVNLQGSYTPNIDNSFTFDLGIGTNDVEIPIREDPRGFSNREVTTNHQQLKWIRGIGDNSSKFTLYRNYYQIRDDASFGLLSSQLGILPEQVPFVIPGQQDQELLADREKGFSERIDFEYEQQYNSPEKFNAVFGVGLRRDVLKSNFLTGDETQKINIFRLFSNIDYQASDKANINFGFLAEKGESLTSVFSPRLAFNYQLSKAQTLRASVSRGLHAPSQAVNDAFSGLRFEDGTLANLFVFSPNEVKPEKIKSYELAYIHRWPKSGTQLDIKFFQEDIEDVVKRSDTGVDFPDQDGTALIFENSGFVRNRGLELQLEHKFLSIPDFNMRLSYAYIDSDLSGQNGNNTFRFRNSIPQHSGTLLLNKKMRNGLNLSSVLQYQSDSVDTSNTDQSIRSVDFKIGKSFKLSKSKNAKIDLSVQNVFNHYNDISIRNDKGTRAYLKMQLEF